MAPIVHGLEVEYFGSVNFVFLDIDDKGNAAFLSELEFKYQPQFVLIDGEGKILQQWFGFVSAEDFRFVLDAYRQ